jgi:hypothetical protein
MSAVRMYHDDSFLKEYEQRVAAARAAVIEARSLLKHEVEQVRAAKAIARQLARSKEVRAIGALLDEPVTVAPAPNALFCIARLSPEKAGRRQALLEAGFDLVDAGSAQPPSQHYEYRHRERPAIRVFVTQEVTQ